MTIVFAGTELVSVVPEAMMQRSPIDKYGSMPTCMPKRMKLPMVDAAASGATRAEGVVVADRAVMLDHVVAGEEVVVADLGACRDEAIRHDGIADAHLDVGADRDRGIDHVRHADAFGDEAVEQFGAVVDVVGEQDDGAVEAAFVPQRRNRGAVAEHGHAVDDLAVRFRIGVDDAGGALMGCAQDRLDGDGTGAAGAADQQHALEMLADAEIASRRDWGGRCGLG